MAASAEDRDLARRLLARDPGAQAEFHEAWRELMVAVARNAVSAPWIDADDVASEVELDIVTPTDRGRSLLEPVERGDAPLRGQLMTTVRRRALDALAGGPPREGDAPGSGEKGGAASVGPELRRATLALRRWGAALPPAHRGTLLLDGRLWSATRARLVWPEEARSGQLSARVATLSPWTLEEAALAPFPCEERLIDVWAALAPRVDDPAAALTDAVVAALVGASVAALQKWRSRGLARLRELAGAELDDTPWAAP